MITWKLKLQIKWEHFTVSCLFLHIKSQKSFYVYRIKISCPCVLTIFLCCSVLFYISFYTIDCFLLYFGFEGLSYITNIHYFNDKVEQSNDLTGENSRLSPCSTPLVWHKFRWDIIRTHFRSSFFLMVSWRVSYKVFHVTREGPFQVYTSVFWII